MSGSARTAEVQAAAEATPQAGVAEAAAATEAGVRKDVTTTGAVAIAAAETAKAGAKVEGGSGAYVNATRGATTPTRSGATRPPPPLQLTPLTLTQGARRRSEEGDGINKLTYVKKVPSPNIHPESLEIKV